MNEKLNQVTVKGYNKKHTFAIERTVAAGYEFIRFTKNGNVVLNCTPEEFCKFRALFV
jgi:hypothetical protein